MTRNASTRARTTRACLTLILFTTALAASTHAQNPAPPSCKSQPEYRQFDFWVGEWNVMTPGGELAGTNSVQLILGDCVLLENWTGARGMQGKSFNVYNASKGAWQQTWVDSTGNVLELTGKYEDGRMRFAGVTQSRDGKKTHHRLTFTKLSADRVRQLWEQSADGGETWKVVFDGMYLRKK